ncbi:DNA repair protein RecN [soil metagenome]
MLTELVVQGLGVIDETELVLGRGMSALTGETGAGKTLVVAALGLLLGGKADRTLVRSGSEQARIEGRFVVSAGHPAVAVLAGNDLLVSPAEDTGETEIVVARTVAADGRGRARVNGRLVRTAVLADIGSSLVEIAGQHEHARISTPAAQRHLLDAYAGADCLESAHQVGAAVRAAAQAGRSLEQLAGDERARVREMDSLREEIAEIEAAGIEAGEEDALRAEAARLEHADAIAAGVARALDALGGDGGAEERLSAATTDIAELTSTDEALEPLAERLRSATYECNDIARELAARVPLPDPDALEMVRGRLGLLARLRRRYGADTAEVLAYLERAQERMHELERADIEIQRWAARRAEHVAAAESLGRRTSSLRAEAARDLERDLTGVLAQLALPEARFEARLDERSLYEGGYESVTFLVAANPGEELRPLAKVASGGELARIALGLHLVTAGEAEEAADTMVFDEVDAGVGGEAAQAVGRCLAQLARDSGGQVLVVTHLPQVAAFADVHLRVRKETAAQRARSLVETVAGEERVAELSRMLAGLPGSERARGHARELLELAASP